ncbi:hypothetical protein BS78_10G279400 [Paspalum vaginatum]|nr:hypothetical protein BS78_10G279400 [Paspalum vaginatum]
MSSPPVSGRRRRRDDMEQTASAGGGGVQLGNRVEVIVEFMGVDSPPRGEYDRRREGLLPQWLTSARPPDELFAPPPPEEGHKRARIPASSKAIQSLKEVSGADGECAVCLSDFCADDDDNLVREMPCSHVFHQHCIFRWLRVNHVCPLCRHALRTELDEDQLHGYPPSSISTRPASLRDEA